MINASGAFKEKLSRDGVCVNYAVITLSSGDVLELEPSDFMLSGNTIIDKSSTGSFAVGSVIGKQCTLTLANHNGQFSGYDFYKAIIYLYVGMQLDDGTIEKIRKGKYIVTSPKTAGETISISGVDSISNFDKPYNTSLAYPADLRTIVIDACLNCGVNMAEIELPFNITIEKKPENTTYRQVLTWIAQICSGFFRMDVEDYIRFVFYQKSEEEKTIIDGGDTYDRTHDTTYDGGNFEDYEAENIVDGGNFYDYTDDDGYDHYVDVKSLTVATDNIRITGVIIESGKEIHSIGDDDYAIKIKNNPFVEGHELEVCVNIMERVGNLTTRPLSAQIRNNPLIEPFDMGFVHDRKGNQYIACFNSITYATGGFTTVECLAENPVQKGASFYSEDAAEIVQMRRETEERLNIYDKAVQNMNMLAANSMGVFTSKEELEDGSTIHYMHDKPLREESRVIYKMTVDGFFVSQDGGKSYTAGFDSEGNAILNVLSVIGITFDWARGGTLHLGGDNNTNGEIRIYDKNGIECGVINNSGIAIYSPSSQLQILMSPVVGFILRDASGNEFYGLSFDTEVTLDPVLASVDTSYLTHKDGRPYVGVNDQPLKVVNSFSSKDVDDGGWSLYSSRNVSQYGFDYRNRWRFKMTHNKAYVDENDINTSSNSISLYYENFIIRKQSTKIVQLPDAFKGKEFEVVVTFEGFDERGYEALNDRIVAYQYYSPRQPYCYEDCDYITPEYAVPIVWSTQESPLLALSSEDYSKEYNNAIKNAKESPYINANDYPDEKREKYYKKEDLRLPSAIDEYDYSYTVDKENAQIIIKGWALGKMNENSTININEAMKFRVRAAC